MDQRRRQRRRPRRADPAAHESRLYGPFSHFYDVAVGRFFIPRVIGLVRALPLATGAKVLELGVGTGISLPAYPRTCSVIGIDYSPDMLREAQERIDRGGWTHIQVEQGDATALRFPDDSFDVVTAFHVVTVVPDHHRLMHEAIRVCRPGGLLAVVNRFRSREPVLDRLERGMEPWTRHWGWRTLRREEVFDSHPLEILEKRRGGPLGLFTAVVARNLKGFPPSTPLS
jgi:phosphatidylethanolamine/phosphatidyl-N-methylethanolamine N-methyltransferase